ncbi:SulP family inorganic anion transporter [Fimbriiglobus ruber]|uniref:Sulfate transporter n=1 Tax=Fimbriiglobus ruber TaxID=1908690 RepID=A0A225D9M2_9BACT|nr:SulP family inorganic anion transporter [Fimbriiglobus ruber]OWK37673.1 Sulfate transporter [Fimbriiglobus ruber]
MAGGLICSFISNSQMTIKGPAAGLIVIVLGAVTDLGELALPQLPEATVAKMKEEGKSDEDVKKALKAEQIKAGYTHAIGVGVAAGVVQILFGVFRLGTLAEICPMTPVHALLASIGIIIFFKQAYPLLGLSAPGGEAIQSVIQFPEYALGMVEGAKPVPQVAAIGFVGLIIMIAFSFVTHKTIKKIPAQLVVLVVTIPLALALNLKGLGAGLNLNFLITVPNVTAEPQTAFFFPDFSLILSGPGIKYVVLFSLIGSLESIVSAKAVDTIDPYKRKTNLNRDTLAVGIANTAVAFLGGLPMISEIVRSKANIDNGARTSFANFFHACFLLLAAVFLSGVLALIPAAALAAMLVFTGFRLAHPREFVKTYKIGIDQIIVFLVTIGVILATDLLIGFFAGIAMELIIHLVNRMPIGALFGPGVEVTELAGNQYKVSVQKAAVFANWLPIKKALDRIGYAANVMIDLSNLKLVDHTVMDKLHELEAEYHAGGGHLTVEGLESFRPLSKHPLAARKSSGVKTMTPSP